VDEMTGQELRAVVEKRVALTAAQRRWCIGELTGPLAAYNPLPAAARADDAVLADCLLRAWIASTRCDCL